MKRFSAISPFLSLLVLLGIWGALPFFLQAEDLQSDRSLSQEDNELMELLDPFDTTPAAPTAATPAAPAEPEKPVEQPAPQKVESEYDFDDDEPEKPTPAEALNPQLPAVSVARFMPRLHVLHTPFNNTLSPAAWTNFIDRFDYEHIYFTQEDLADFEASRNSYLSEIRLANTNFPTTVCKRFIQRVKDRHEFISSIVSNAVPLKSSETYTWRRNKLPFAANTEELNALWTKRIQNSLLAAIIRTEIDNENATNEYEKAIAKLSPEAENYAAEKQKAFEALTNSVLSVESVLEDTRKEILENNARYLEILQDSDQEYWLSRWLSAATSAYDPHSDYMTPAISEDFDIDMNLSLQGIGATLQIDSGAAKVMELVPGSPAETDSSPEHLVPGDRIIAVAQGDEDFVDIRHWPLYKAVRLIRGPKGTKVRLRVIPVTDQNAIKIVTLIRDEIKMEEQAADGNLETVIDPTGAVRKIGYINLPTFYSSQTGGGDEKGATQRRCSEDIAKLIAELSEQQVEGLVLDLRGNGGGSLSEAIEVAGLFIKKGPVVQVREDRNTIVLQDRNPAIASKLPMVVLVDRISASASEIVAAALQDYRRAVVIGDSQTHGKGTVQTLVPLGEGKYGSLKATTALFYRINGSATQIRGVASDIHLPSFYEGYSELGEDKLPGALVWTHIPPAGYKTLQPLELVIPELRKNSEARLATNQQWQVRAKLLESFTKFNTNSTVSLDYATRRQRALEDNELTKEIAKFTGKDDFADSDDALVNQDLKDPDSEGEKKLSKEERKARARKNDIVLNEALNILIDLIDLNPHEPDFDVNGDKETFFDFFNNLMN